MSRLSLTRLIDFISIKHIIGLMLYRLDWEKITNDKDFQRLVNDVVSHEINKPGFMPSSPYIGADNGWDGRYKGDYLGINGLWSFQTKFTKKNLEEAFEELKPILKKELQKAKENKVDNLIFVTNADLRDGEEGGHGKRSAHIMELEKLNVNQVKNLYIWHRENLEMLINRWSWIRYNYFQISQYPKFIPSDDYFSKIEKDLSEKDFIKRDEEFKILSKLIDDKFHKAIVLHAPGGCGKSHFLKNFVQFYYKNNNKKQILFLRHSSGDFVQSLDNDLNDNREYVLIFDDAERYMDECSKAVGLIKAFSVEKIKIILSCRSSGKDLVISEFNKHEIDSSEYNTHRINDPSEKELELMLNSIAGRKIEKANQIIKTLNKNLYLITTTGRLIKKDKNANPNNIKDKLRVSLVNEVSAALKNKVSNDKIIKILRDIALIVPLSEKNENIIKVVSDDLGMKKDDILEIIKLLEKGEILRRIGNSLRFNPDMKGDIFLSTEIDGENGEELIKESLNKWMPLSDEKVIANIADATRHSDTDNTKKVVCDFIQSLIDKAEKIDKSEASKKLELVSRVVFICPEKIINLISVYLDKITQISRDSIGKVLHQLIYINGIEKDVLYLIKTIEQKKLKGTYSNYETKGLVRNLISPVETSLIHSIKSIDELLQWVKNEKCTTEEAILAAYGASEALAGSHEHVESYGIEMSIQRKILNYSGKQKKLINELRDKSLSIMEYLLFHKNKNIRLYAVDIIKSIGQEGNNRQPLFERIIKDELIALTLIKKFIKNEPDGYKIINKIEDYLIRIWAGTESYPQNIIKLSENILDSYKRSPEYTVFSYYTTEDIIIINFDDIKKDAPIKDRWRWLVDNHFNKFNFKQSNFDKIIVLISEKYKTKKEIIKYLKKLDEDIGQDCFIPYIPLIETWYKFNKKELLSLCENSNFEKEIPERFYKGFITIKCQDDPKYLEKYADNLISDSELIKNVDKVDILLSLVKDCFTVDQYLKYTIEIINKTSTQIKSTILHRSYFIFNEAFKEDRDKSIDVLIASLDGELNERVMDMFSFLFKHLSEWDIKLEKNSELSIKISKTLRDIKKINYYGNELLEIIYKNDLPGFLNFIDYRLIKYAENIEKENSAFDFDPVPNDIFSSLKELINTYEDFKSLMEKIFEWDNKGIIYHFDKEHLVNDTHNKSTKNEQYLIDYINDVLSLDNKDGVLKALSALDCLDFGPETQNLYLKVIIASQKFELSKKSTSTLWHKVFTGSYTSGIGEAPKLLVDKKTALISMKDDCSPGEIKTFIEELISSLSEEIQNDIDRGQELINPKT